MPGVFSLLGLGGNDEAPGGSSAKGRGERAEPSDKAKEMAARLHAQAAAKEPAIKSCSNCGEMRKTTAGLCAACFLTAPSKETEQTERAGRRKREKENAPIAIGGEGRLPSLTLADHGRPGLLNSNSRARSPDQSPSGSKWKSLASGTSSSSGAIPNSSSGGHINQLLEMQKAAIRGNREDDSRMPEKTKGFSAAAPSQTQSTPQLHGGKNGKKDLPPKRDADKDYRAGGTMANAKAAKEEEAKGDGAKAQAGGKAGAADQTNKEAAEKAAKERLGRRTNTSGPPPDFPGGYRRGDVIQSLVSRIRNGREVIEVGHEGTIMSSNVNLSVQVTDEEAKKAAENNPAARLLIQFKHGYDYQLAPHQVCLQPQFIPLTAAGLPGGLKWGDKVQTLVAKLSPQGAKRGLCLGEEGTVVGPGALSGKIAVRFGEDCGEWSVWPNAVCKLEAYATALAARLPGGFRRGDRVKSKALKVVSGGDQCGTGSGPKGLEDGQEGTVVGPGHAPGRLLVCFDGNPAGWSVEPTSLVPV